MFSPGSLKSSVALMICVETIRNTSILGCNVTDLHTRVVQKILPPPLSNVAAYRGPLYIMHVIICLDTSIRKDTSNL